MNRLIIYGDIHGCYNEFISLRNKIDISLDDIEICVGDLITKGSDSIKVLDFVIKNKIKSVLGNHEDKLIRYIEHEKRDFINPIVLDDDEKNIISVLKYKHIKYLKELPFFLKFGEITVIHGGLQNSINLNDLSKRDKQKILRLRYLDKNGNLLIYGKEDEESIFWSDVYNGHEGFIVYGHQHFDEIKINKYSIGIDTGCVYGNKLSAIVFSSISDISEYKIYSQKSSIH